MKKKGLKKDELRKKEIQKLINALKLSYSQEFCSFLSDYRLFRMNMQIKKKMEIELLFNTTDQPVLYKLIEEDSYIPTVYILRKFPNLLPKVTVDAGAVKFMINGSDLFRQGVVTFEKFKHGDFINIVNEQGSSLAIHKSIAGSDSLPEKGRISNSIHHLNDEIWNFNA